MNILICTACNSSYNSLRPELEIYIGLAKAGCNITLISDYNKDYTPRLIEHGISVIENPFNSKLKLSSISLIHKVIKQRAIDIAYATSSKTIPNTAFACIGTRAKLIVYRGTTGGLYRTDPSTYLTTLHPRVDGVICVSNAVEQRVRERFWKKKLNNVVTIYKGHDINWYNKTASNLNEFESSNKNFNVACVANARIHKGLIYMIRAAAELADLKNLHIILVGRNISDEPYISEIKNSGMEERIHITGYRHDAPEIIAACDILVSPSLREGLPRVILESLAYKTPVITSANPGGMEIIDDGVNGYVVPLRNSSAIAERIRYLYEHPDILENITQHSQDKLKTVLSSSNTVKNYLHFFQRLIEK